MRAVWPVVALILAAPLAAAAPPDKEPADPNTATARSTRWVLQFRTTDARDYLTQLRLAGVEILVPLPPDNKEAHLFPDLNDLTKGRKTTADDLKRLAGMVRFSDNRPKMAEEMATALGLDAKPKEFRVFVPKELADELARKEQSFRNRKPEDIEETVFRATIRAGKLEILVDDQRAKR